MSREIKFRAYSKSRNRYLGKGDTLIYRNEVGFDGSRWWASLVERQDHSDEDIIVEQYTGLKDKNGREIYEGDFVKFSEYRKKKGGKKFARTGTHVWVSVIEWDEVLVMWGENKYKNGKFESGGALCDTLEWEDSKGITKCEREVVGNIHENPELLGAGV